MIEFGDQNDFGYESTDLHPRSFGWVAGVVVLAIVLGLVVGVDHGRTVVASRNSLTAARIAAAPLRGSPIPALTSPDRPTEYSGSVTSYPSPKGEARPSIHEVNGSRVTQPANYFVVCRLLRNEAQFGIARTVPNAIESAAAGKMSSFDGVDAASLRALEGGLLVLARLAELSDDRRNRLIQRAIDIGILRSRNAGSKAEAVERRILGF